GPSYDAPNQFHRLLFVLLPGVLALAALGGFWISGRALAPVLAQLQVAVGDIKRFTADASHELRTPVALVRTTAELALRRERTPDEYRTALAEIHGHSERMSDLVEELLALARSDAGIEPAQDTPFALLAVARKSYQEAAVLAATKGVRLSFEEPDADVVVGGDGLSLRRVLTIFFDNAVRYSPAGGLVRRASDTTPATTKVMCRSW
ncbi:MAG TPA: histidine kinase dimerization/phospho-acceptor domain-containing protein, partial [Anaerolineae bacterium]|nr:histidine kinase dimerization/phospho-acceptor domain-containing protein [Anaerolineae bacterium]